jgi:hypothetical protein
MVFPRPDPGHLPSKLAPGELWTGLVKQNNFQESLEKENRLFICIYHAFSECPNMVRVSLGSKPRATDSARSQT